MEKKIPYIDENADLVNPESPNGYKFEQLVLDMIHEMDSCLPFEVVREKEFAPIKNKTGVDSVESARALLLKNADTRVIKMFFGVIIILISFFST